MPTELKKLTCICCGGELTEKDGKLVCKYCKSTFEEVEKISEEEVVSLNRATTDRNLLRFDEALEEYNLLLKKYPQNEMANWGAFLCDYGIIYEQDYDNQYIPTCHRLNERPVSASPNYARLSAEHQANANEIEKLRHSIMEKAKKIQPYDVFICYKATEEKRGVSVPTREASWARDIYELLTKKGLRVFFAEKSLAGSNVDYEPHIYSALRSAKLMFVLAGSIEHVNATWVANEWKRYAKYVRDGEEKTLRVIYDFINPYDLPKALQNKQAIDHNDMGWDKAVEKAADDIFIDPLEEERKKKEAEESSIAITEKKENKISNKGIFAIAVATIAAFGIIGGVIFNKNDTSNVDNPQISNSIVIETEEDSTGKTPSTSENSTGKTPDTNENSIYVLEDNAIVGLTVAGLNASILRIPAEIGGIEIKEIGAEAFAYATNLTTVVIPSGITKVGDLAFKNCAKLERITIPDGIAEYGEDIFYGCEALKTAEIAANAAFVLPRTIESVVVISGEYLSGFSYCTKLSSVVLPDSLVEIGQSCFYECAGLNNIVIPDSVTNIGAYAFRACNGLNDIIIPNGVTTIREHAFADCDNLESITIGDNVTTIEMRVFWGCQNLSSVKWGNKIESIGEYAFNLCENLENVYINNLSAWFAVEFGNETSNPLYYAKNLYLHNQLVSTLEIPNGVTVIKPYAFYACTSFKRIIIPASVTSIGEWAFRGGNTLEMDGIYISDLKAWCEIDFGNNPLSYANNLYLNDSLIEDLEIPDGVTTIKQQAFQGGTFSSVSLTKSVTSIEGRAFSGCGGIKSITIPDGVTTIGELAFASCDNLTEIIISESVISIGNCAFSFCENLRSITVAESNSAYKAVNGNLYTKDGKILIQCAIGSWEDSVYVIPDGVTVIADYAFASSGVPLSTITIPDSVVSIGEGAFQNCSSVTNLVIGSGVTSIGMDAFRNWHDLTTITFNGTKAQWNAIKKDRWIGGDIYVTEVICTDGTVSI